MEWQQTTTAMYFAGGYKLIRMFDVNKECRVADFPTACDACVTSLNNDVQATHLVLAACSDGYIRVFDNRQSPQSR